MKGLLVATLSLSMIFAAPARAWWGKFSSYKQAMKACHKWKRNGPTILVLESYIDEAAKEKKLKQLWAQHDYATENSFLNYYNKYEQNAVIYAFKEKAVAKSLRRCTHENVTRQFLGEELDKKLSSNTVYKANPIDSSGSWSVKNHFRY